MKAQVIAIDDDQLVLKAIESLFADKGIQVYTTSSSDAAITVVSENPTQFKMAIVDYQMQVPGDQVVREIKEINPAIHTVVLSGLESKEVARKCQSAGADHFYPKGKSTDNVLLLAEVATQKVKQSSTHDSDFANNSYKIKSILDLVGRSSELAEVANQVKLFSQASENVLINGETGVGKEKVAQAIHKNSPRKGKPFVAINCGALPADLIESELFGHVKGAFTGATANKAGKFLAANEGTIFLDEIGELSADLQVKLLRVLQEREISPLGSNRSIKLNVRVVSATNRDLKSEIKNGSFREDLYYRLNVLPIQIPALSDRKEDIIPIAEFIVDEKNKETGLEKSLTKSTLKTLEGHSWPGNVRELDAIVRKAYALSPQTIDKTHFSQHFEEDLSSQVESIATVTELPSYKEFCRTSLNQLERKYLDKALALAGGSKPKAAELTGMPYTTYLNKREKLGLDLKSSL